MSSHTTPRYPAHLTGEGPVNPFPGIKVLERKLGRELPHRLANFTSILGSRQNALRNKPAKRWPSELTPVS
jgi:hypothetical protein